jgi:N-acetylglucosamine kinase-like BadF-type ATPase
MLLVAESGSTKTQWNLVTPLRIKELIKTPGINPVLQSTEEIETILRPICAELELNEIKQIHFFGAGCATTELRKKVAQACFNVFNCKELFVESDMIAACLALAADAPGIIGILGTGSNSCAWNGNAIDEQIPALGYIMGDEGGGVSIGKQLIIDYLKGLMPHSLGIHFGERYQVSKAIVIERVYQMQGANRYLASFAPFVDDFIENEYCYSLVKAQFRMFIIRNILQYSSLFERPVYCCGSTAHVHASILREVCSEFKLEIKNIIKEPIANLSEYLQKKLIIGN